MSRSPTLPSYLIPVVALLGGIGFNSSVEAALWIEDFNGSSASYQLKRAGKLVPIQIYLNLQRGDRLDVKGADKKIRLKSDDGQTIEVSQRESPYIVEVSHEAPNVADNLLQWIGAWITARLDDGTGRRTVSAVSREKILPITIPLVSTEDSYLIGGRRTLHLAWQGGYPPFRIRITHAGAAGFSFDRAGIRPEGVMEWNWETPKLDLSPGRYHLSITDDKRKASAGVQIVDESEAPEAVSLKGQITDEVRETLRAVCLAADPGWRLEAFQKLSLLGPQHPPAEMAAVSFARGHFLPDDCRIERETLSQ